MRLRTKACDHCSQPRPALYRCRYDGRQDWQFLCGSCLDAVKSAHTANYQYGGTWKAKKR